MVNSVASQDMEKEFLAALVCPVTHQSLRGATVPELTKLGIGAALVREDGRVAYPVRDGIPVLLADAAIQIE
jgi:uncharacterized protein YbaR (Trm112 family)